MPASTTAAFVPPTQLFPTDAFQAVADILGPQAPHVVIDGGAHLGRMTRRALERLPNAHIYAFEPVDDICRDLEIAFESEPRVTPIRAALGAFTGQAEFFVNNCEGTSSLLAPSEHSRAYHPDKVALRATERVPVVALDDWTQAQGVERVDFLKLDLQGYELEALKGAERLLRESVRAVYSEAQLVELYEDAALFSDIDRFLRDRGFDLYRIQEIFGGGPEQRSTCCDAIWIERDTLHDYCERISATR